MACPAIITGDQFLLRVIGHIDCQAQLLGSYGYQALGQPGSVASTLMAGLLTLFVALFGIRLLFGPAPGARDVIGDVIKIGIVITLAFSWPAFRTVVHDLVLDGPAEIANTMISPSLSDGSSRFAERLQKVDVAMVRLAELGTGRNTGAFLEGSETGASFSGTALQDDSALGYGRLAYLGGIITSLGLLRLVAALLLALAPLAAGLLLFEQTRGIFSGWLRGLVLAMIGSIGVTAVLAMQLSILEPWLADAIRVRNLGYATPSAPMEMLAISSGFAVIQLAMVWLLAKVAFNRGWISVNIPGAAPATNIFASQSEARPTAAATVYQSRAERISDHVETIVRRETGSNAGRVQYRFLETERSGSASSGAEPAPPVTSSARLGSSYRRTAHRSSQAARNRDSSQ